jgi:hypothetical protein
MNNTTRRTTLITTVAILMAATLVVGTFATITIGTQSAFAYQKKKGDKGNGNGNGNANTITLQKCKQLASGSGFDNTEEQECENLICTHPGENATCVEEGATNTTAAAQARPRTCEECFTSILTPQQLRNSFFDFGAPRPAPSLAEFCEALRAGTGINSEEEFRLIFLQETVTPAQLDVLIACLKSVGIVFRP